MVNDVIFSVSDIFNLNKEMEICFGDFQKISVGIVGVEEANKFLNSLWREFNENIPLDNLGRCPWAYLPKRKMQKEKSVVLFGSMNTSIGEIYVAISYMKKGSIDCIGFLIKNEEKRTDENRKVIERIVSNARNRIEEVYNYSAKCMLYGKSNGDVLFFENYKGKNFELNRKGNEMSELEFYGKSHDKFEFENEAIMKISCICDFLSAETNLLVDYHNLKIEKKEKNIVFFAEDNEVFQENVYVEEEFIDMYPVHKGRLIIQKKAIDMLEYIIDERKSDKKVQGVIQSCKNFREGIEAESVLESRLVGMTNTKNLLLEKNNKSARINMLSTAITFYMSALENLTIVDYFPEKCNSCGQLKYEISNRVGIIVEKYWNDTMAKVMKKIYAMRSGHLHSGKIYIDSTNGTIRPNLDILTGTNCVDDGFLSVFVDGESCVCFAQNVREWVGYIIRKECELLFAGE